MLIGTNMRIRSRLEFCSQKLWSDGRRKAQICLAVAQPKYGILTKNHVHVHLVKLVFV